VITPDNCVHEMERLIATARAESRPAYILVASDYAITRSWPTTLLHIRSPRAVRLGQSRRGDHRANRGCRSLVVLPAYTVSRFKLQRSLQALIETLGCPFATMAMDKGFYRKLIPSSSGRIRGRFVSGCPRSGRGCGSRHQRRGASFNDINTSAYSSRIAPRSS